MPLYAPFNGGTIQNQILGATSATSPAYAFSASTNSGLFWDGSTLGVRGVGVTAGFFTSVAFFMNQCSLGTSAANYDVGLRRVSANLAEVNNGSAGNIATLRSKYQSSDGSVGATAGPFTVVSSIQVKDGIVTTLTGS